MQDLVPNSSPAAGTLPPAGSRLPVAGPQQLQALISHHSPVCQAESNDPPSVEIELCPPSGPLTTVSLSWVKTEGSRAGFLEGQMP